MESQNQKRENQSGRKLGFWDLLKIILAVVLIGFVLSKIRLDDLAVIWQRISILWLIIAILSFGAGILVITRRYWILIGRCVPFRQALSVVIVQTVLGNLIATTAGFASYVAILRGKHQVRLGMGVLSLVAARFFDLLVWFPALIISSIIIWPNITPLRWLVAVILAGMICIVLLVALILVFRHRFLALIDRVLRWTRVNRFSLVQRGMDALTALAEQEPGRLKNNIRPLMGYSALTLLFSFGFFYGAIKFFAVPIGPWPVLFMFVLTQLLMFLPIHVFGGLGLIDVPLLYLYGLFGITQHAIAPVIIGGRVILYGLNLLLLLYLPVETLWHRNADPQIEQSSGEVER